MSRPKTGRPRTKDDSEKVVQARTRAKERYLRNRESILLKLRAYYVRNAERLRQKRREYAAKHPERVNQSRRGVLGVTKAKYAKMLAEQNGLCAACRQEESLVFRGKIRSLAVDHDHKTGSVRGLLCNRCNRVLGFVSDSRELLEALIEYLGKPWEDGLG